jgi:type VI protein secretion system component Hcp
MPTYMKIEGVSGPLSYENTTGWFKIESAGVSPTRQPPPSGGTGQEATAPPVRDVAVTRLRDGVSMSLFKLSQSGQPRNAVVVFEKGGPPGTGVVHLKCAGAVVANYTTSASQGSQVETFLLDCQSVVFEKGSPASAARMVRPSDWGTLQAADPPRGS